MAFIQKYKFWFLLILAAVIIVLRKPDSLFHAQFVAEDGRYWYADAYNHGLNSLVWAQDGYLQTLSRITGLVSLAVPFQLAPTVFTLVALLVQLLPVGLLLSNRLVKLNVNFRARLLLAGLYLFLPNTQGSHLFLTNSQFYLSLSAALLIIFSTDAGRVWIWFKRFLILLSSLSGLFSFLLLPVTILKYWKTRDRNDLINALLILIGALIQGLFMLSYHSGDPRFGGAIEWRFSDFYSIWNHQFVWNALVSPLGYSRFIDHVPFWNIFAPIMSLGVLITSIFVFVKSEFEIKLYLIFAALVGLAAILFPLGVEKNRLFYNLAHNTEGLRYWIIPMTAVLGSLVYSLKLRGWRIFSGIMLSFLVIGILFSFRYPQTASYGFFEKAREFESLGTGQQISIPLFPVPQYWVMTLIKH